MTTNLQIEMRMQPSLNELLSRYLNDPSQHSGSLNNRLGMMEPYEVQGAFRPDARQTWRDATSVMELFGLKSETLTIAPEWDSFTDLERTLPLLPIGFGLFPQRVSATIDWNGSLSNATTPVPGFSRLRQWLNDSISHENPKRLLIASGIAATLGDTERAVQLIQAAQPHCDAGWQPVWRNQKDAVAFLTGTASDGLFPQERSDPLTQFNRGVLALHDDNPTMAHSEFESATSIMPETSSWHHLAKLYQSVAEMRGQ